MKRLGYLICSVVILGYVVYMLAVEGYDTAAWIIAFGAIYVTGYWQRLCNIWTREYSRYSHVSESTYWQALALIKSLVWFLHPFQLGIWICGKHHYVRSKELQQDPEAVSHPLT
ncbi:MAG TPA: hypothetical protein VHC21_03165 [Candidatus Saccharimonadales bacterium]|nr:hypothetical protein [Candidatus Saccharimonadales bacterium]